MSERQQAVTIKGIGSEKRTLVYGVPHGSVLGPELFKDYVAPLSSLIQSFRVNFHGYADDTQIYVPFVPGQSEDSARDKIQECIAAVKSWMAQNWLKLNDDTTEFIIIGSPCNLKKVVTEYIVVGDHKIFKSKQVRNIGAIFDTSATMEAHVIKTAQTASYHLYSISKICPYLTTEQNSFVSSMHMLHPDWTRITACSVEFQRQHFFVNSRKCRMLLLNSSWVGGSGTMRHHSFKNCTGFPCPNVTSSEQFCWYTKHCKETALRICRIC